MRNTNKFVICTILLMISALFSNAFADGENNLKNSKGAVMKDKDELLSFIQEGLESAFYRIEKTIVLTVPDENGYIYIEPWEEVSKNKDEKYKININNMEAKLRVLYKEKIYDTVILTASKNVSYGYLHNVIHSFEDILKKDKLLKGEGSDMPRYLFSKPY